MMIRTVSTEVVEEQTAGLTALVDRARHTLSSARVDAKVLEEVKLGVRLAYDGAKTVARVKGASDALIAASHRVMADALLIESEARRRIADEYDAAQAAGDVAGPGQYERPNVPDGNVSPPTAADLGLTRKEIHEARKFRDAETKQPGIAERAVKAMLERGAEPTRAELRRVVHDAISSKAQHGESVINQKLDEDEFRKFRKFWKGLRPGAKELARQWLATHD